MIIEGDNVIFSSGKVVYANGGIIGLCEPGKYGWDIYEGYDGAIDIDELSKQERIELADYMIALWQRLKDET